jgi:hypothetical protein
VGTKNAGWRCWGDKQGTTEESNSELYRPELSHVPHSTQPLQLAAIRSPSSVPPQAMMLVHKQHPFHLPQAPLSHRRLSSAPPIIVVQPTRTPGLLSLSKPPQKASPQRQLNATQRAAQQKQSTRPRPQQVHPQPRPALLNAAEITDKKTAVRPPKNNQKQSKAQR